MARRHALAWSATLRDLKADRTAPRPVREERLSSVAGLRGSPVVALSAWRGVSGHRYVFAVHTLARAAAVDAPGAVILGVRRSTEGIARIVGAGWRGTVAEAVALAAADGATEIHVHHLAEDDEARDAIVEDLMGDDAL